MGEMSGDDRRRVCIYVSNSYERSLGKCSSRAAQTLLRLGIFGFLTVCEVVIEGPLPDDSVTGGGNFFSKRKRP